MHHDRSIFTRRNGCAATREPRSRGFTLVELLVVIGIIAVLLSIMLPVVAKVRQQVDTAKCLSNLRQIGVAISTYANDHNFCLVPGDHFGLVDKFNLPGAGNWANILADQSYISVHMGNYEPSSAQYDGFDILVGQDDILHCSNGLDVDVASPGVGFPTSQTDGRGAFFFARGSDTTRNAIRTWYACNCALFPDPDPAKQTPFNCLPNGWDGTVGTGTWQINRLTQFNNDSNLPLIFDGTWCFNNDPHLINARHNGNTATNILFADFHCETQLTVTLPNDNWYLK